MVTTQYSLRAKYSGVIASDAGGDRVEIKFKRTVRVPDNDQASKLPPDLGDFQLYKVRTMHRVFLLRWLTKVACSCQYTVRFDASVID